MGLFNWGFNMIKNRDYIHNISVIAGIIIIFFIVYPIFLLVGTTDYEILQDTIRDSDVIKAIITSLTTGSISTLIAAVFGIMLLFMVSNRSSECKVLEFIGLEVVGTKKGIIAAMLFVSLPLMINSDKNSFLGVSSKMENVSR